MSTLSEIVQDGLHYPWSNLKNTVLTGIFFLLTSIFFVFGNYYISQDIYSNFLYDPETFMQFNYNSIFGWLNQVSPTAWAVFIICILIAVVFYLVVQGYIYRVYENTVQEKNEFPEFNNFKSIFIQGFKILIVNIAYSIIPDVLIAIGIYYNGIITVIGIILEIIAIFILPLALSNMCYNESLKSAFEFKEIINILKSIGVGKYIGTLLFVYLVFIIIAIAWFMVITTLNIFVLAIPFANILCGLVLLVLSAIIYAYIVLFSVKVNGLLYNNRKDF